jgi:ribosomal RNA-processing protein 7
MVLPATVGGFNLIPVGYSSSATHYIYARRHSGSKKAAKHPVPNGRTLFLVNVPPDATERELVLLFNHCGTIESVVFDLDAAHPQDDEDESDESMEEELEDVEDQPRKRRRTSKDDKPKVISLPGSTLRTLRTTGRTAYLVFLDSSSLDRALSSGSKLRSWPSSSEAPSGLSHYSSLYESLRPPLDAVRQHADSSMELYEYELQKSKQQSKYRKGEAVVDEDGFTLVTRGGAYGKTLGGEVGVASKKFQEGRGGRHRNKKKDDEKAGFYAFQKAEKQRKGTIVYDYFACLQLKYSQSSELMDLKKKWEEDKAKVEKLKASRTFKPY